GTIYYDRNDNGVRDAGEPGVAGIAIHDKTGGLSTVTDANGDYSLVGLPSSGYLQVETGWFRSQCPPASSPTAMNCSSGPGADNDYAVDNQFLRHTLTAKSATNVDAGIVPGWPGRSMTIPAAVDGVVPANPVDVAARLSWSSGKCVNSTYEICRAGDTFALAGAILNEGTTALTGVQARVYVPPGDCATGASLIANTVPSGLGALSVTPSAPTCSTRYVDLSLGGSLTPGAGVRILIGGETVAGPGTPGCNPKKINKSLCPTQEPQGRGWLLGVSHIDQTGDPDSTFCAAGDMTLCPIGLHDKRRAPDEIDPAGHNVDSTLSGSTAYDLAAHVEMLDSTTVRAWVANPAAAASPEKSQVKVWLPADTTVVTVPAKHVLITCDAGKVSGSAVVVTCTLGGPVAPTLSSPAIDLTLSAPPSRAVVCVTVPAGSPAETVPAGSTCNLATNAASTATDNDATISPATS
ncbi:MAG TPA: SdrD B-like domain-containing protein, partial [Micromonosporaceae bacterium]